MIIVAGFVGLGVCSLLAAVLLVPLVRPTLPGADRVFGSVLHVQLRDPWRRHELSFRYGLYALVLALLYPMLSANEFLWPRADTKVIGAGWVVLDVVVWCTAYDELSHLNVHFRKQYREAAVLTRAACVCLLVLGLSATMSDGSRFLALLSVLPLALIYTYLAWASGFWRMSRASRSAVLAFAVVGLLALLNALLGPVYSGVEPVQAWAALTMLVHLSLFGILLWMNALVQNTLELLGGARHHENEDEEHDADQSVPSTAAAQGIPTPSAVVSHVDELRDPPPPQHPDEHALHRFEPVLLGEPLSPAAAAATHPFMPPAAALNFAFFSDAPRHDHERDGDEGGP